MRQKLSRLAVVHSVGGVERGRLGIVWECTSQALCRKTQLGKRVGYRIKSDVRTGGGALILPGFPFSVPTARTCALVLTFEFQ